VDVPEALLVFLWWAVSQGGLGLISLVTYPVHKPTEAKTIQRLMTVKEGNSAAGSNGPREMGVEGHRDPCQSPTPQVEEDKEEEDAVEQ
jgi:hypothetical protein